jgi:hypothetical protein
VIADLSHYHTSRQYRHAENDQYKYPTKHHLAEITKLEDGMTGKDRNALLFHDQRSHSIDINKLPFHEQREFFKMEKDYDKTFVD